MSRSARYELEVPYLSAELEVLYLSADLPLVMIVFER
jgi:hypothetical protein